MDLQDVQELSNFFERRVSAYQVAVGGTVAFDEEFLSSERTVVLVRSR
jgi:ribonucleoside-diphosphate reductase beta chain